MISYYFGRRTDSGHYLHINTWKSTLDPETVGLPWPNKLMDTGLLKNGKIPDQPDGRVYWTCARGLWTAFFWWDRTGDSRPGSNSGFYVQGFEHTERQSALDFAMLQWPDVVSRQAYPLILVDF